MDNNVLEEIAEALFDIRDILNEMLEKMAAVPELKLGDD